MRNRNVSRLIVSTAVALCTAFIGCARSLAPPGTVPESHDIVSNVYGGWLTLTLTTASGEREVVGEFIALEGQHVVMMVLDAGRAFVPTRINRREISYAKLEVYSSNSQPYLFWTLGGALSTLSHGFYLIITAPIWLVSGTVATINVHNGGSFSEYEPQDAWWLEVAIHARFPQGLPRGVTIETLEYYR